MATLLFHGHYIASKASKTALADVTIDIHRVALADGTTSEVVTAGACSETGDGLYRYRYAAADLSLYHYVAVMKTADATVDQQHVAALGIVVPDALVGSRAVAGDAMTLADDAITAGKIAADAIGASELAASATAEIAAAAWTYATRTLTSTAAATTAAVSGSNLALSMTASYAATITGLTIPATWTKIWWTLKRSINDLDSAAQLQVVESNPGAGTDGTLYVAGAAATVTQQTQGSLTVDQVNGTVAIALDEALTAALTVIGGQVWDIKCLESGGAATILTAGDASVERTVTRAM